MTTPLQNSVHLERGCRNDIAFVFSCPGQKEKDANPPCPAQGQTGTNLEDLLQKMRCKYGRTGFTRNKVWITNAWSKVEFKYKTPTGVEAGRSEASFREIVQDDNLDRLARELRCIEKLIVCCGDRAIVAIACLKRSGELTAHTANLRHLGTLGLNWIKKDVHGNQIGKGKNTSEQNRNRLLRIEVVAKSLYDQLPANLANDGQLRPHR